MRTYSAFVIRHPWLIIASWALAVVGMQVALAALGSNYRDDFNAPNTDSQQAAELLERSFPAQSGDADLFVWQVSSGTATDDSARAAIEPADVVATMTTSATPVFDGATEAQVHEQMEKAGLPLTSWTFSNSTPRAKRKYRFLAPIS